MEGIHLKPNTCTVSDGAFSLLQMVGHIWMQNNIYKSGAFHNPSILAHYDHKLAYSDNQFFSSPLHTLPSKFQKESIAMTKTGELVIVAAAVIAVVVFAALVSSPVWAAKGGKPPSVKKTWSVPVILTIKCIMTCHRDFPWQHETASGLTLINADSLSRIRGPLHSALTPVLAAAVAAGLRSSGATESS